MTDGRPISDLDPIVSSDKRTIRVPLYDPNGASTALQNPYGFFDDINPGYLGNPIAYGADPTGVSDSTAAFQAAIDSDYAVFVTPGDYSLGSPLTITKHKIIQFAHGLMPEYSLDTWDADSDTGSGVRLIKTADSDFFQIRSGRVYMTGFPLLDVSALSSYTSMGVKYDLSQSRVRGWGGRVEVCFMGNQDTIINDGEGATVIGADWETGGNGTSSYLTTMEWHVIAQDIRYGLYIPPLATGENQFCNSLHAILELDGAKMAYRGDAGTTSRIEGQLQARHIIHADELSEFQFGDDDLVPVSYWEASNVDYRVLPYDLSATVGGNGRYRPSIPYFAAGRNPKVDGNLAGGMRRSTASFLPQHQSPLYAPQGILPWRSRSLAAGYQGMVLSALVNPLAILPLKASSYTFGVYDGTEVDDYLTLTDDSVTEGISTSSDIALSRFDDGLWQMEGTNDFATATANATAVTDEDYIEIHFHYTYRASHFMFSWESNGGFDRIQIIRKLSNSILENVVYTTPEQNDEDPQNCIYMKLASTQTVCDETIIRLIAPRDSTKAVTIHDICALGGSVEQKGKYVTIQGGQTVHGDIALAANVDFTNLPTSDPVSAGRLWSDSGTVKVSAG